jgi:hypothetical protein
MFHFFVALKFAIMFVGAHIARAVLLILGAALAVGGVLLISLIFLALLFVARFPCHKSLFPACAEVGVGPPRRLARAASFAETSKHRVVEQRIGESG